MLQILQFSTDISPWIFVFHPKKVTFGNVAYQVRPTKAAEAAGLNDQLKALKYVTDDDPEEETFMELTKYELEELMQQFQHRMSKMGKVIQQLESEEIDVIEAELKEPTSELIVFIKLSFSHPQ